jgi:iron complex outermembrane receptor protein
VIFIEGLSAIVSYGMGARSSDAAALSDGELAPFARVNAFEAGLVYARDRARATSFDTRLIGYLTKVDRDLLFNPVAGRNELVGASNRFGAVASARLRTVVGVETQASVTYAEAYLPAADAGFFDLTSGVRLPFIPRWVGRIDTSIRRAFSLWGERFGWELASGASYVGPPPLPLNQLGEDIFVMDVAGRLRWRFVEAGVEVTNLFDRRNRIAQFNHPSNFASPEAPASQLAARHFAAGAPLQALGTVTLHFDTSPAPTPEDEANDGK